MTPQQIYNKVKSHLLKQNAKSKGVDGDCKYRGPNGMKCAIGCLIPDKLYLKEIEGKGIGVMDTYSIIDTCIANPDIKGSFEIDLMLLQTLSESVGFLDNVKMKLMVALQSLHDNTDPKSWPRELEDVAEYFNLQP